MDAEQLDLLMRLCVLGGAVGGICAGFCCSMALALWRAGVSYSKPQRGMGQGPMCNLCRATCPAPSGGECPARRGAHVSVSGVFSGVAGRWIKRCADPRPGEPALPRTHSRLQDNVPQALPARASGADRG